MRFGWLEILVIVVLLFILFGSAKIPSMMKNLAGGIKTFKKEMKEDDKTAVKKTPVKKAPVKKTVAKKKPVSKKK